MDVKGKKVVLFGGTSGIGLAAAQQLVAQGAKVIAISRDPSRAGDVGDGITLMKCDVRDAEALQSLFAEVAPFDVLISAATGGDRAIGPFMDMDMDGFKASFDKLWGYANVVRYGASHLPKDGCIVLVSGTPARRAKMGQVALGAVGGAVESLGKVLARELAPIRVNVVCPGQIDTPMIPLQGEEREKLYESLTKDHLIPRAGTADEVAHGIVFAVTNDFVTGNVIDVDGGIIANW